MILSFECFFWLLIQELLVLLQMLTVLESAVKRDYLSLNFETSKDLLRLCKNSVVEFVNREHVTLLPWIPLTISAVSLRLLELDDSIAYIKQEKEEDVYIKEHNTGDLSNGRKTTKRSGDRKRKWTGGGERRRRSSSGSKCDNRNSRYHNDLSNGLRQQGRTEQGYSRGPRTVRRRRTETTNKAKVDESLLAQIPRPRIMGGGEGFGDGWRGGKADFASAAADSDSDSAAAAAAAAESDENGEVRFRYGDDEGGPSSNGWNKDRMEVSEEDQMEVSEEEEEAEASEDEEEEDNDGEAEVDGEEDYRFPDVSAEDIRDDAEYSGQEADGKEEEEENVGSESAVSDDYYSD